MTIHLRFLLPKTCSGLPRYKAWKNLWRHIIFLASGIYCIVMQKAIPDHYYMPTNIPLFNLAPSGVCRAIFVTKNAVCSYHTISPLPNFNQRFSTRRYTFCCTFPRVAPAGRYPALLSKGARTFLAYCKNIPTISAVTSHSIAFIIS